MSSSLCRVLLTVRAVLNACICPGLVQVVTNEEAMAPAAPPTYTAGFFNYLLFSCAGTQSAKLFTANFGDQITD